MKRVVIKKWLLQGAFLCLLVGSVSARVRTIQTQRDFNQLMQKSELVVALFYDRIDKRSSQERNNLFKALFHRYERISSKKMYDDADIVFVKLNTKHAEIKDIAHRFHVLQGPCTLLFKHGMPIVNRSSKKLEMLCGFSSEDDFHRLIQNHFAADIAHLTKRKENNRKERVVQSQKEADPYFYPAVYYAPEYDFTWQKPLKYNKSGDETQ